MDASVLEDEMRKLAIAAAALAIVCMATPAISMGSGGSGMGYGGGGMMSGAATFDDYAVAMRLIHHQQYAEAIPHLDAALSQRPRSADILNYEGYTHRMVGDYQSSLDYYKRALAIDPDHKGVHEYLGELYLQMNDQASAQNELTTLATLCPSGCDERDALTKALASYAPPAGTAANTTAPTAPTTPATGTAQTTPAATTSQ
jgi:tetratricopeptide (TPR) repeat protein